MKKIEFELSCLLSRASFDSLTGRVLRDLPSTIVSEVQVRLRPKCNLQLLTRMPIAIPLGGGSGF